MFSSKLRVAVGTVAAAALLVAGTATSATIQRPGGPTAPQKINWNPTMPKRVSVGVAFGGMEKQSICGGYEAVLNWDLEDYWDAVAAGNQAAATAAKNAYDQDEDAALNAGCFVQEL